MDGVAGVCFREGRSGKRVLLIRTSGKKERWTLPKGKLEATLGPKAVLRLEFVEEAGMAVHVNSAKPLFIHYQKKDGSSQRMAVYSVSEEEPVSRARELRWVSLAELLPILLLGRKRPDERGTAYALGYAIMWFAADLR